MKRVELSFHRGKVYEMHDKDLVDLRRMGVVVQEFDENSDPVGDVDNSVDNLTEEAKNTLEETAPVYNKTRKSKNSQNTASGF